MLNSRYDFFTIHYTQYRDSTPALCVCEFNLIFLKMIKSPFNPWTFTVCSFGLGVNPCQSSRAGLGDESHGADNYPHSLNLRNFTFYVRIFFEGYNLLLFLK